MNSNPKPKVTVKKLAVRKSALRELSTAALTQAVGGGIDTSGRCMSIKL